MLQLYKTTVNSGYVVQSKHVAF